MTVRGVRDPQTRRCPIPHEHCAAPGCRWCGLPVESKRGGRWHAECVTIYHHAQHPARMRQRLAQRDGLKCWLCSDAPTRWLHGSEIGSVWWGKDHRFPLIEHRALGPYCEVERVTALQVDHVIPLWSVRHLPDRIRWLYFMIENCILLCPPCHKAKSAREAKSPAHPSKHSGFSRARKRKPAGK